MINFLTKLYARLRQYTAGDRARRCLAVATHPVCGVHWCELSEGHDKAMDKRMHNHRAACRKHRLCVVSWESKNDGNPSSTSTI